MCDGLPTEVHDVPSLGKLCTSTNLTEKGYACLKQLWEPRGKSLYDANWLSSTEVNEACQIMAAEALKTHHVNEVLHRNAQRHHSHRHRSIINL